MSAKRLPPLSLRLSADERARLERMADGKPLGGFIKACLFGDRRKAATNPIREEVARALALLGQSGIGPAIRSMARDAERGTLPLDPETQASIRAACADVAVIKSLLMKSLGIKER
ncbi:hypothetical protein AWH62_03145 [Maricaulis sp. W15]|uniref:hypothetical protein n=1 Tax=Maricaulis sp. W15 TaxID=1772333 RepID=UPI000948E794|nr:hypothetical protein [Maricaulis sp. W15]OLF77685.1 hypothetical protein AWH62_03145 [Maricaulis sp. W15]